MQSQRQQTTIVKPEVQTLKQLSFTKYSPATSVFLGRHSCLALFLGISFLHITKQVYLNDEKWYPNVLQWSLCLSLLQLFKLCYTLPILSLKVPEITRDLHISCITGINVNIGPLITIPGKHTKHGCFARSSDKLHKNHVAASSTCSCVALGKQVWLALFMPFIDHKETVLRDIRRKQESIPVTGMMGFLTQTRLFLANALEKPWVLGILLMVLTSCQPHVTSHKHSLMRGGGVRKHERLRRTEKSTILGISQKMLTSGSIYQFHSEVLMNDLFFYMQSSEMFLCGFITHMWTNWISKVIL